jgi:hypothetical protein
LLTIDDRKAVTADTHHQMVLPRALGSIPVMMASRREPADIGRIDRTNQGVLSCMREDRSRYDEHILSGKAFNELQRLGHGLILKKKRRKNIHQIAAKVHFHWVLLSSILGRISGNPVRRL